MTAPGNSQSRLMDRVFSEYDYHSIARARLHCLEGASTICCRHIFLPRGVAMVATIATNATC